MLRFSKKADYALIALKDLSSSSAQSSSTARAIAGRYDIPVELMAKVLQRLSKMGVIASHKGIRGGYYLDRDATEISVADVIQAIDGPVLVTACSDEDESCDQYSKCNVRDPLWRLKKRILEVLSSFTVDELIADESGDQALVSVVRRRSGSTFSSSATS
jgi:Rrf2 family protein